MKKNVASQLVSAQMVSSTDGSDVTSGTCNVAVEIDGSAGTGGTATHIANGKWEYAPIQADTNGDYLTFQFVLSGAITQTVQIYTTFPQTADVASGVDVVSISGGSGAADNLEAMYDGTGYVDAAAPATQEQLDDFGVASGSLVFEVSTDNTGGAIESVTFVGTQTGTNANTDAEDGVYHQIDHSGNAIDIVYEFDIGANRTAVEINFRGYLDGSNDTLNIQAYNWTGTTWETIRVLTGQGGTGNVARDVLLLSKHTGTGADDGRVLIRFVTSAQTSPVLYVDQIVVAAVTAPVTASDLPTNFADMLITATTGLVTADIQRIDGSATVADALADLLDGTGGVTLSGNLSGSVGSVTGAVGSVTAGVTLADGAHGGSSAVLTLDHVVIASTTDHGISVTTSGASKHGIYSAASGTGASYGMAVEGNTTSGVGLYAFGELHGAVLANTSGAHAGNGLRIISNGTTGAGMYVSQGNVAGVDALELVSSNGDEMNSATVSLLQAGLATSAALTDVDTVVDNLNLGIIYGAAAGSPSTTSIPTDLTGYADDQLIGRVVIFTSGSCDGEATDITDYTNTNGVLTVTALTTAPSASDTFKIV